MSGDRGMDGPTEEDWHAIAEAAEAAIAPYRHGALNVANKLGGGLDAGFDPVTEADRAAERAIRAVIAERFPNDAVLGEEFGTGQGTSGRRWVIDPIDGTRAFVAGIPTWMTLVGLEEGGRAVAGLAVQPVTGERFVAHGGRASVHDRAGTRPLAVRASEPREAVVMTVDPFMFEGTAADAFHTMRREAQLTRYSADAYAFCALAAGSVQVVFETGMQPYDICALIPIMEAAGGVVTTWEGGRPEAGGDIVAAASPALHDWARGHLSRRAA